jgi:hypothetical protein
MKLYIWADPYHVSYGTSMLLAVARSVEEAKQLAARGARFSYVQYKQGDGMEIDLGEPTRIVDLPCAEWHEWSE